MNKVRLMEIDDLDDVLVIEELCFMTPWSRDAFESELTTNERAKYLVILQNDRVIGYGGMWFILDEGHITNIAIHPEYEGKGLGTVLVTHMIQYAKVNNINSMTLEVRESNTRARGLYEKLGFRSCGKRPNYYQDSKEDAVIMWGQL